MIDVDQIDLNQVPRDQVAAWASEIQATVKLGMPPLVDLTVKVLSNPGLSISQKAAFLMLASRMGHPYPAPPALMALYGRKLVEASANFDQSTLELFDALRPGLATSIVRQMMDATIERCHNIAEAFGTHFHLGLPSDQMTAETPPTIH